MVNVLTSKLFSRSSIFFSLVSLFYGFKETDLEFSSFFNYILIALMCFIFFLDFIIQRYKFQTFLLLFFLFFIALLSFVTSGTSVFLISVMSAIVISHSDYIWCFKILFIERLLCNFFINFLSFLGFLPIQTILNKNNIPVLCYSFGYQNPNKFACVVGMLILLFICIKNVNISLINVICIAVLDLVVYYLTQSRTFLFSMLFCFLLLLVVFFNIFKEIFKFVIYLIMPICMLFSLGIPYLLIYGSSSVKKIIMYIDVLFSGRFSHSSHVLELYPVRFLGGVQNFERLQNVFGYSVVDNGYIRLLYGYGIFGVMIFLFFYFNVIYFLFNNCNLLYFLIPIAVFAFWGISENVLYSTAYNFSILLWGIVLNSKNVPISQITEKRPK